MRACGKFPGVCGNGSAVSCMPVRRAKDESLQPFPLLPIAFTCSVVLDWRQSLGPFFGTKYVEHKGKKGKAIPITGREGP
jgi:hypothetical protein